MSITATAPRTDEYAERWWPWQLGYAKSRWSEWDDADMIDAIGAIYGSVVEPTVSRTGQARAAYETDSGTPVARWGNADSSLMWQQLRPQPTLAVKP